MSSIASLVTSKIMRLGMSGPEIKELQMALAKLGYPLTGTGYFGTATDTAVTAFQRKSGLDPEGDVGTLTACMIDAALASPKPAANASPSPAHLEVRRPLWLQAGMGLLGTKEVLGPGNNPKILEWAKEEGGEIAKDYTADSIAWCALGVGHCLTLASIKGTGTLWALDYGNWGVPLIGPAVGAIAYMKRSGGGHVTIVAGKDQHGNIMCLGFNQGDTVSVLPFPPSRMSHANGGGFRWPKDVPLPVVGIDSLPIVLSNGKVSTKES